MGLTLFVRRFPADADNTAQLFMLGVEWTKRLHLFPKAATRSVWCCGETQGAVAAAAVLMRAQHYFTSATRCAMKRHFPRCHHCSAQRLLSHVWLADAEGPLRRELLPSYVALRARLRKGEHGNVGSAIWLPMQLAYQTQAAAISRKTKNPRYFPQESRARGKRGFGGSSPRLPRGAE